MLFRSPISLSQDTVRVSGPATQTQQRPADYTQGLDKDALKGARIGVPSDPSDPFNDTYYGKLPPRSKAAMEQTFMALQDAGAILVRANMPTQGWIGGPGTTMPVLNRNPLGKGKGTVATPPIVFLYELKRDLNLYLRDWAQGAKVRNFGEIVAFNEANAEKCLRFGQDLFLAAQNTRGDLKEAEYVAARQSDLRAARTQGLDTYMEENQLDAVLFPGTAGASIAAKAGWGA